MYTFKQWIISFFLFSTGLSCIWNSITLVLFDDRRLNRLLLSSLLLIVGIILLCDGFIMIKVNVNQAENIKSSVLVILFFVGILSSVVIWDYKNASFNP